MKYRTRGLVAASATGVLVAATGVAGFEIGYDHGKSVEYHVCVDANRNPKDIGRTIVLAAGQADELMSNFNGPLDGGTKQIKTKLDESFRVMGEKTITVIGIGEPIPKSEDPKVLEASEAYNYHMLFTAQSLAEHLSLVYGINPENVSGNEAQLGSTGPGTLTVDITTNSCA